MILGVRRGGSRYTRHLLFPGHRRQAVIDLQHRDAAVHRAHKRTQIASHTFLFDYAGHVNFHAVCIVFAVSILGGRALDALVRTVFTSDIA
jgi:hypothetical protein